MCKKKMYIFVKAFLTSDFIINCYCYKEYI